MSLFEDSFSERDDTFAEKLNSDQSHHKRHAPHDKNAPRCTPKPYPEGQFCYKYPHAAIAADCVIFGFNGTNLKILLIERGNEPFKGYWALPGGFMRMDETIEETAARELEEETNLRNVYLEQFKVYSGVKRDPRERVVSVAFFALVRPEDCELIAGDDAAKAAWFDEDKLPLLAFDHAVIIREAREQLKQLLYMKPVAFELLNKTFTINQLQSVYEVINQAAYDRRNFLRTAIDAKVITEVEAEENRMKQEAGRSAKLYRRYEDEEEHASNVPEYQRLPTPPQEISLSIDEEPDLEISCNSDSFPDLHCFEYSSPDSKRGFLGLKSAVSYSSMPQPKQKKNAPTKGLFDFLRRKR